MKYLKNLLIGIWLVILAGCTSQEGQLKKLAVEAGQKQFQTSIEKEAKDTITQSDWLRQAYVDYLLHHTEFSAGDVKMQGEQSATVDVKVETYTQTQRRTLLKIAGTIEDSKARRFNFSDALQMISGQMGTPAKPIEQAWATLHFEKKGGDWVLQEAH